MRARQRLGVLIALVVCACGTHPASNSEAEPNDPEAEPPAKPAVVCRDADRGSTLAQFAGPTCPWVLRTATDGDVDLLETVPEAAAQWSGELPEICAGRPCSFRGTHAAIGPVVVVEVGSAESEMPGGAWLGYVHDGRLRFVDLWEDAGEPVIDGGVELGPAHALAPFDCAGALALLATPRTQAGEGVPVFEPLRARERMLADDAAPPSRESCTALTLSMP